MSDVSPAPTTAPPAVTTRNAIVFIAVVAGCWGLWALREILTPLALAVFLAVMIDGLARVLATRVPRFPAKAALPTAVVISVGLLAISAFVIGQNAGQFVAQIVGYGPKLDSLLGRLADAAGVEPPPGMNVRSMFARLNLVNYVGVVAQSLQSIVSDTALVAIYLGFILASRRGFKRKAVAMFPSHDQRVRAGELVVRMRDGIERYLWVQTVTGLLIAVVSFGVMAAVGLDNALFWAFLIFIACYVPIIGGGVAIILPTLFALVQFDTFWQAGLLVGSLMSLHFVIGNVILPRMQGDSLNVDPLVVLLSLAFWGVLWGMTGMFLSTPLTVAVMVILAQFEGSRPLAVLLSDDGDPQGLSHRGRHGPSGKSGRDADAPTPPAPKRRSRTSRPAH